MLKKADIDGAVVRPPSILAFLLPYQAKHAKHKRFDAAFLFKLWSCDKYRAIARCSDGSWHGKAKEILTNPLYAGYIEYKPWGVSLREDRHEGIIS